MSEKRRARLNLRESMQLAEWLRSNIGTITRLTQRETAELATKQLGFAVTPPSLRSTAKAADVDLQGDNVDPYDQDLTIIYSAIQNIKNRVMGIEHHIEGMLYPLIKDAPPPSLITK